MNSRETYHKHTSEVLKVDIWLDGKPALSLSSLRITYNLPLVSLLIITKKKNSLRDRRVVAKIPNLDVDSDWLLQLYTVSVTKC